MNQHRRALNRVLGKRLIAGGALAVLALVPLPPANAAGVQVGAINIAVDEYGSGGIFEFQLENLPSPAKVFLERNDGLDPLGWQREAVGTIALSPSLLYAVTTDDSKPREFYRFRVEQLPITIDEQADGFLLELGDDTPLGDLLTVFAQQGRALPALLLPYDPDDVQNPISPPDPVMPAGKYFFNNFGQLPGANGPLAWLPPPADDDDRLLGRYPPTTHDQSQVDEPRQLPGDGGSGSIEDGWNGDEIKDLPVNIGEPPNPAGGDMAFNPDIKPSEGGDQDDAGIKFPGTHLRLVLGFTATTVKLSQVSALPDSGNGLDGVPPPLPSEGFVMVLRAPGVNAPGGIYHIDTFLDPLAVRSYDPPTRGSHGSKQASKGSARLRLPLLADDPRDALGGLVLQIYQLGNTAGLARNSPLLTPTFFNRNEGAFNKIFETTGAELLDLLPGPAAAPPSGAPRSPVGTPTITTIHRSGSNGSKFNLCILGDGFSSSNTDQTNYQNYVTNVVLDMFANRDVGPEIFNAVNIYRIDAISQDSGMTLVDSAGTVTTARNTALEYRYSGNWNRCWMEKGPNSDTITNNLLTSLCPQADQVIIVLNTTGQGGCARGNSLAVTRTAGWNVLAHEVGHMFGRLGDEYQCNQGSTGCGPYSGSEPGAINLTVSTNRNSIDWAEWIPSWRPVPTTTAQVADTAEDVGIFPGGTIGNGQWWTGIYRPSFRGRMNNNTPPHNPVGYVAVRDRARTYQEATFRKNAVGDFNGDGRADLVRLDGRQLALYLAADRTLGPNDPMTGSPTRSVSGVLDPKWFGTDFVRNSAQTRSWQVRPGDVLVPGDFDGDGKTDLYIANFSDWSIPYLVMMKSYGDHFEPVARYDVSMPGWQMRAGDQYFTGDLDGDGDDDLMVYNGTGWSIPYFCLLRSNGSSLSYLRRYDRYLPVWEMGRHEKFIVGDYNGDKRADVIAFNTQDWAQVHLQVQSSTGSALSLTDRFYGTIPGIWQMRRNDQLRALDFSGDGSTDIAIFNGLDWGPVYLGLLRGIRGVLTPTRRYDNANSPLPGWQLQRRDQFWAANFNGDRHEDLVVYNKDNWSTEYLGMLRADVENTLHGSWQANWIGGWNLGAGDSFRVADFRGGGGWDDLYVYNDNWFGLLRSYKTQFALETIYRKWIHNHRYHKWGWW